ncbi:U4/U6 X U5 tri-snRNP complex subunit [Schizosaccharomyces osmophilus]|uniref:U4/U6 X U5 tri-snRNP complex subunit n=1 Tax=Schizosaccharomyces osmophilus TaxID=2545709 RepID=A0AAE9WH82_9SCHI|nr:U4/U6 X U5 tri-snRNP complex subunit [Schizosaccharomyces osmophilus]WBW75414.1 U4/U6 X U5 tri-snRNP complex subunit [Schizosaccharomyces osmophilus]
MSSSRRNYEREENDLSYRSQRVEKEGLPRTTYRDARESGRGRQREGGRFQRERSPERRSDRYARTRNFNRTSEDESVRSQDRERNRNRNRDWDREGERGPERDRMVRRDRYDRYDRHDREEKRREDVGERPRGGGRRGEQEQKQKQERTERQNRRDFTTSSYRQERVQPVSSPPRRDGQQQKRQSEGEDNSLEAVPSTSSANGNSQEEISVQEELDPVADMQSMMGFSGFGTTTGKKHGDVGDVFKQRKARYRQYMNRPGGFNRPLERD